ncbi:heparinase II/III family protein [Limnobacter sp.]
MTAPRTFKFLNRQGQLDAIGWDGEQREKLWRYNQHYFDDLNAVDAETRRAWHLALIDDWIARNPPGQGTGWEPYPLSLRVVNWVKWALSGGELSPVALHSLAIQARWLTRRLEVHLLGNHLFANAKALLFAGLFFEGKEADRWRKTALEILAREIPEQFLVDGGQFELSTMYHALAMEDALDMINVVACYEGTMPTEDCEQVRSWLTPRLPAMRHWLMTMCHPDGEIGLFNDAAFGIAPAVTELEAYFARCVLDTPALSFKKIEGLDASGYLRLTYGPAVALLDVARIGPDYLPGHAHADTLSFELSVGAQRVLVNSGTSCYGISTERLRQRGTAAHNTVVINGEDSSEVWGGFRVARRAYPIGLCIREVAGAATEVSCTHNGYTRLPGKPVHHRIWRMDESGLTVTDYVEGPHRIAEARFHFHPAIQLKARQPDVTNGTATLPDGTELTWLIEEGQARLERSSWHPRFGEVESNFCLVVKLVNGRSGLRFSWLPSKAIAPNF